VAVTHLVPVATHVIMVADREGDIYSTFARRPDAIDFVVRACHNRVLAEGGTLFAAPAAWPTLGRVQIKVAPKRRGDKGRKARVVLKARTVTIKRPNSTPDRQDATKLTLGLVEVREEAAPAKPKFHLRLSKISSCLQGPRVVLVCAFLSTGRSCRLALGRGAVGRSVLLAWGM
jgi:hypothetical protein